MTRTVVGDPRRARRLLLLAELVERETTRVGRPVGTFAAYQVAGAVVDRLEARRRRVGDLAVTVLWALLLLAPGVLIGWPWLLVLGVGLAVAGVLHVAERRGQRRGGAS